MIKKPDLLSAEEKLSCSLISKYPFRQVRDVIDEACIHQLDVCVKHYEPLIKEMYEALKNLLAETDLLDIEECEHDVGICWCFYRNARFQAAHVIAKVEGK